MNRVLQKLPFAKIYLDNIVVHTSGSPEEHLQTLKQVVRCLREANLKLKGEICVFYKQNLHYLGYIIDKNEINQDPLQKYSK